MSVDPIQGLGCCSERGKEAFTQRRSARKAIVHSCCLLAEEPSWHENSQVFAEMQSTQKESLQSLQEEVCGGCWRQRGRRFGEQPETHSTPIKQFEGRQSCQLQPKVRDSSILSHLAPTSWPVLGARISKAVSGSMLQWNSHTQPTRCIWLPEARLANRRCRKRIEAWGSRRKDCVIWAVPRKKGSECGTGKGQGCSGHVKSVLMTRSTFLLEGGIRFSCPNAPMYGIVTNQFTVHLPYIKMNPSCR